MIFILQEAKISINCICILRLILNSLFLSFLQKISDDRHRRRYTKKGRSVEIRLESTMTSRKNDYKFLVGTRFHFETLMLAIGIDNGLVHQSQEEGEWDISRFPLGIKKSTTTVLGSIRASSPASIACPKTDLLTDLGSTLITWGGGGTTTQQQCSNRQLGFGALLWESSWKWSSRGSIF
jgi:hypothetical protein